MLRKRLFVLVLTQISFTLTSLYAAELLEEVDKTQHSTPQKTRPSNKDISKAFGHLIYQNLETLGFDYEFDQILVGMQDASKGTTPPLMEQDCIQAISEIQEETHRTLSKKNMDAANAFMSTNKTKDNVIEIEPCKLQYTTVKEGKGPVVEKHFTPLVKFTGKLEDGNIFVASSEHQQLPLSEAITGLSKGIVGMKEGEKRTLFVHPEYGYGVGGYLPPNSLLIFDVEVVEANQQVSDEGQIGIAPEFEQEGLLEINSNKAQQIR